MHLAFVDITYGYTADRPEKDEPLGGTTAAICFLARALKTAGIRCTFFNTIDAPRTAHGIPSLPLSALAEGCADKSITAFLFCGRWLENMVKLVRAHSDAKLVAWMHESTFNKLVPVVDIFDGIIYVSEWQQRVNQPFVPSHWRQTVIRSGMSPPFADLFAPEESIVAAKAVPPILLYVGHFTRGAFHIPPLLDHLRRLRTDFTMEIFANLNPSTDASVNASYIDWIRRLPNVTHVGQVERRDYAPRLKRASFLIAPNPWPETSCVALIEAMAAGLSVITTNRAVLPETASGFARHVAIEDPDHLDRFDMPMPYEIFAAAVDEAIKNWQMDAAKTEQRLRSQVDYFLHHFQWSQRVAPCLAYFEALTAS